MAPSQEVDLAVVAERVKILEVGERDQWELLEKVRDRLPNWAVWAMVGGGGLIGFLVNWIINCVK